MTSWLQILAPYSDYGWFIALVTWLAAAIIARWAPREQPAWVWLSWIIWAGVAEAGLELATFAWPMPNLFEVDGALCEDFILGLISAVAVSGLIRTLPARGWLRAAAIVGVFALAGLRAEWNGLGATAIALAGTSAGIMHLMVRRDSLRERIAVFFVILALWLTSAGPLADLGLQPRFLVQFGEWSVVWGWAHAASSVAVLVVVASPWFAIRDSSRELAYFSGACVVWLGIGLGLAAVMSRSERINFERQAIVRAQMAASLMDKTGLSILVHTLRLTDVSSMRRGAGGVLDFARVPVLTSPAGIDVQRRLALIEAADPDRGWAMVHLVHAGWQVRINSSRYPGSKRHLVGLSRMTSEDWQERTDPRAMFMPLIANWRGRATDIVNAKAPLFATSGQMLGWLVLDFSRDQWLAAQAEPRMQAYVIVVLGFILAALVAVQRIRIREREVALAAAAAAEQADRLKTTFLAKVSHELRTPIQSVLGYGEMLRESVHEPVARRRLAALCEHGELMKRLVNDLLDLGSIHAGAFRLIKRPSSALELVQQTVESFRPGAEQKGLSLIFTVEPGLPAWVDIDPERVRQVTINLLGNAIKFTDHGRVIVTLTSGNTPKSLLLTVQDTGPGISAEDQEKLFQLFGRLNSANKKDGTGLGLALSAGLCRGMGGNVEVESQPGAGSIFRAWFEAPACSAPDAPVRPIRSDTPLRGLRILVAEDNALVRELFVANLEGAGAQCAAVEDGEAAWKLACECVFDGIILDLAMPHLDGLETAIRIRARAAGQPKIVGVSAHAGVRERTLALAAGMDVFLVKPVEMTELLSAFCVKPVSPAPSAGLEPARHSQFCDRFRSTAEKEGEAVAAAIALADFALVRSRAHHLMNSAAVVRDDRLFDACIQVEAAAIAGSEAALNGAWIVLRQALEPWIEPAPADDLPANFRPIKQSAKITKLHHGHN